MYLFSKKKQLLFITLFMFSVALGGTLKGTITFSGKPPKKKSLKMDADPVCSSAHRDKVYAESFILNEKGQMANVFVYLKNVSYKGETPKEAVVLDQKGCIYNPHVFGIMKDQELIIKNSDPTMHNIHSMAKVNNQFNFAMPKVVKEKKVSFKKTEEPFYIKCDVHPWMKAWTTVTDHPYFAVTDKNGDYEITGIPSGTYEVKFWQERLSNLPKKKYIIPSNTLSVDVKEVTVTNLDFEFQKPKKK